MESFSRGLSFLQQAWQMAFKDKDLIKPAIYPANSSHCTCSTGGSIGIK